MTIEGILREVRRRVGDVDGILDEVSLDYSDDFVYEYISSAMGFLEVTMPLAEFDYSFDGYTISPEPTTVDGLLISALAAKMILKNDVLHKIRSGELGVRFRSGLDELSTIEAGKMVRELVDALDSDYRQLVMGKLSGRSAGAARLQ